MPRPSYVEVDLDAIRSNVEHLRRTVSPAKVCVVVKADAYGHGDVPVAEAALEAGADLLAVALVQEGIRLREAGIAEPILLLIEPPVADVDRVLQWDLMPSVQSREFVDAIAGSGRAVHLAIDTGMHRAGVDPEGATDLARHVLDSGLVIDGTWSHLPVAEEDDEYTAAQVDRFLAILEELQRAGIDPGTRHLANSAGALHHPTARLDMVRTGIATYGLAPDPARPDPDLAPAMRLVSTVGHVRALPADARPSYGRVRALPGPGNVATVPIGYADGYDRSLGAKGFDVLVGGRRHPLAGTVTMDQIVVDLGSDTAEVGDEVVLLGGQGDECITAEEWAEALGTINYEVVTRMGVRLPRRYLGSTDAG